MSRFLDVLHSGKVLLMDGAMGTELERAGIRDECCARCNLTHPERVRMIHQAYADAGAEVLLTNTFQSNPVALARHGLEDRLEAINEAALSLARSVAGSDPFVLGDMGPLPLGAGDSLPDANVLRLVAGTLLGADALLLETWSDPLALMVVPTICNPLMELGGLPTLLSVSYRPEPAPRGGVWSKSGHAPEWFALQAKNSGVAALGVNCGQDIGMDEVIEIVRRYRQVTDLPLFARPNAGTPTRQGERWVYPQTPEAMAGRLPELLQAGVSMVGGCCGTTPAHIAAFRPVVAQWNARASAHPPLAPPCEGGDGGSAHPPSPPLAKGGMGGVKRREL